VALAMLGAHATMTAPPPSLPRATGGASDDYLIDKAREQVATADASFGPASPEVAGALADLAHILWGREEYAAALPLAERALSIRLAIARESDQAGVSEYQVGDLRRATGDFAGAILAYRGAIAVWERTRGRDDPAVADALHYLGVIHALIGDADAARDSFARALGIREAKLGPMHERVAITLIAMADLRLHAGDPSAADLFARAQAIGERVLGTDDPLVARGLSGRAAALAAAGRLQEARPLLDRALAIRIKAFGPRHHLVGQSRADRAGLMALAGDGPGAEREYDAALDIEKRALGADHPFVGSTLAALARVQWAAGESDRALATALEAEVIARDVFRRSSRDLDDEAALRFETVRDSGLDVALTALARIVTQRDARRSDPDRRARDVVDALIRSRALVLDALTRPSCASDAPGEWDAPGARSAGCARSAGGPGLEDVRRSLPAGSALAAFARYDRTGGLGDGPAASYLAVVVRPEVERPTTIPLGPASRVDALVAAWRAEAGTDPRARPDADGQGRERAAGEGLRAAIWDPLADSLAGATRVFLVPDGAIDGVSVAALPARDGRYLIETGPLLHYLTAERDIVRKSRSEETGDGTLIVGGPDFGAAPGPRAAAAGGAETRAARPGARPQCPEFAGLMFEPLPGSVAEADEIATGAIREERVLRLSGAAASREAFVERAPGYRVLHLATHAYVLPEHCCSHRPLLRSGLAFAGANRRAEAGGVPGADDGILTAEEIASLDLSGVEWVVLSACETGLGEVRAGEGVVGLRRAFERAGAGTVIMSLWDVDDGAARAFMRALYAARRSGLATSEAMRRAGLAILARQRSLGRSTHPYLWGGFTAVGDWR